MLHEIKGDLPVVKHKGKLSLIYTSGVLVVSLKAPSNLK